MRNGVILAQGLFLSILQAANLSNVPACEGCEGPQVRFFTAIGAGISERTAFRTQCELMNEQAWAIEGRLLFFSRDGSPLEPEISHIWVGEEGNLDPSGPHLSFLVRPHSSLLLTLTPVKGGYLGWIRLETSGPVAARVVLQVAELLPEPDSSTLLSFEHYIQHLEEIEPVEGVKSLTFPIWLFKGLKNVSTAFGLVNLAGVLGEVRLTFRPGDSQMALNKTVLLQPGELLADYFDRFWQLGFPEIFPFEMRASAEVESAAPLGISVCRTLEGVPASGVKIVEKPKELRTLEVALGSEFELGIDQCALIEAEKLRIDFWNVAEDSRCPTDVVCVWEGQAVIELKLFQSDRGPHPLRLTTTTEGNVARFGDYAVKLLKVEPATVSSEKTEISDYRVTLVVTKE